MAMPSKQYPSAEQDTKGLFAATGEYRAAKAGEWFLSGAIIEAYRAHNDLTTAYWIATRILSDTERIAQQGYAEDWELIDLLRRIESHVWAAYCNEDGANIGESDSERAYSATLDLVRAIRADIEEYPHRDCFGNKLREDEYCTCGCQAGNFTDEMDGE